MSDLASRICFATPEWHADAKCRKDPPEWYVTGDTERLELSKQRCIGCPVIEQCLQAGLDGQEAGVWGGTDEQERREIRRSRGRRQLVS